MGLFGGILQGLGGLLGPVGSIFGDIVGAHDSSHAISKATGQQIAGINNAIGEQQGQMAQNRTDFSPYTGFGSSSIGALGDLLGMNGPEAAQKAIAALKASPMFQSLFNTGQEAVLQNASATGGVRGGNVQGALYDNAQQTLAQVIQQQIQSLFGGAELGAQSTGQMVNVNQQGANNISSGYTSIGNAQANKTLGQQQVWNNLGDQISKMLTSFIPGGF